MFTSTKYHKLQLERSKSSICQRTFIVSEAICKSNNIRPILITLVLELLSIATYGPSPASEASHSAQAMLSIGRRMLQPSVRLHYLGTYTNALCKSSWARELAKGTTS